MLSEKEAVQVAVSRFPGTVVKPFVMYRTLYLVQVQDKSDPEEAGWDMMYSVDSVTGELKEFQLFDADMNEIGRLWHERYSN